MQDIGINYDTVGTFLLDDKYGTIIASIKEDKQEIHKILREIFFRWINLGKTSTWGTLVDFLRASELRALADHIETVIHFCAEKYVDLKCPVRSSEYFFDISSLNHSPWNVTLVVTSVSVIGVAVFYQCKYMNTWQLYRIEPVLLKSGI